MSLWNVGAASRRDYAQDKVREGETGNPSRSQPGLPGTGREGSLGCVRHDCFSFAHYLINRGETPLPHSTFYIPHPRASRRDAAPTFHIPHSTFHIPHPRASRRDAAPTFHIPHSTSHIPHSTFFVRFVATGGRFGGLRVGSGITSLGNRGPFRPVMGLFVLVY